MVGCPNETGDAQVARLNRILRDLLERTDASRVTLRVDIPERGFDVITPVAEARIPEALSLMEESSLNQRGTETVKWMVRERRVLVQNDVFTDAPAAPQALVEVYKVRAQMLGPLFRDDWLAGWISVHNNDRPRVWRQEDIDALKGATQEIHRELFGEAA